MPQLLPPSSRITSRATDQELVIDVAGPAGNWGLPAIGGFLGISFIVQGFLQGPGGDATGGWLLLGAGLLLFTALVAGRNLRRMRRRTTLRIENQSLEIDGKSSWRKAEVAELSVENFHRGGAIRVKKTDGTSAIVDIECQATELRWIVEQIQQRWK